MKNVIDFLGATDWNYSILYSHLMHVVRGGQLVDLCGTLGETEWKIVEAWAFVFLKHKWSIYNLFRCMKSCYFAMKNRSYVVDNLSLILLVLSDCLCCAPSTGQPVGSCNRLLKQILVILLKEILNRVLWKKKFVRWVLLTNIWP